MRPSLSGTAVEKAADLQTQKQVSRDLNRLTVRRVCSGIAPRQAAFVVVRRLASGA